MFRKGQNYRIFIDGTIVAEETTCTVNEGVDTESGNNKDLAPDSTTGTIGGDNPIAMYKNMSFQVEAQGNGAMSLFTKALSLMNDTGGAVGWCPTSGAANRTGESSPTYYTCMCNDLTITAPNRQPVTCSAQFTVIGVPATAPTPGTPAAVTTTILRGEFLRLFLTGNTPVYIGAATNCSLHVSLSMEDATTKDVTSTTELGFKAQEGTMITYDITSDCLYDGGLNGLSVGTTYSWELAPASGDHQQTKGAAIAWGSAMLTSRSANAPVAQNITYSATFNGVGVLNPSSSVNNSNSTSNTQGGGTSQDPELGGDS